MTNTMLWKVASPMIGLGLVLATLGGFAAWNIQLQQRSTADAIVREVHSLATTVRLFAVAREIRYQLSLYLRTRARQRLEEVDQLTRDADELLIKAKEISASEHEMTLLSAAEKGFHAFADEFSKLNRDYIEDEKIAALIDDRLTDQVMVPLNTCIDENERVVERTNVLGQVYSQQLASGLLLLGITGGAAGILLGIAVARGIGRSIVQLNISVQSVASRIAQDKSQVSFTHVGDIGGIESNLRSLESDIEQVVETLQQREYELLKSEQLARVGQMAAGLAHELRNPLMPMKMLVQAALQPGSTGQLSQRSLQILNDEILRLEQTVQSFLDFARPRVPVRDAIDLSEFLRHATSFVSEKAAKLDINIELNLPAEPVIADVDRNQMRQLFLNLVNNSMDAMGDGGTLEIELEHLRYEPVEPERVQSSLFRDMELITSTVPDWIVVWFRDTGPGIPDEIVENLFEPFVTTKETGTGLGLSICQQIASAHGGVIRGSNRRDRTGAEFKLMIPQHPK